MRHSRPALWPLLAAKDATAERVTTKKEGRSTISRNGGRGYVRVGKTDANRDLW